MIEKIQLKFGKNQESEPAEINLTPITVFVGPNNSGKSKILNEVHHFCANGNTNQSHLILSQIVLSTFSDIEINEIMQKYTLNPLFGENLQQDHIVFGKNRVRNQVQRTKILRFFENPNANIPSLAAYFLNFNTIILNGQSRMSLIDSKPMIDLQQPPQNSLQVLVKDRDKREELRKIIFDAFGLYLVIDPTGGNTLRIRLSEQIPSSENQEIGWTQDSIAFHAMATPIENTSDGVKAFTGIMTEILAGDPQIIIIDEPEAFLHPSLAFKLGKEISEKTSASKKRIFVATHSSSFILGCISSGAPINIVRLTYRDKKATARILKNDDILSLMRNPLLRSTGVISGLFYESVIVTESDADRAFYQEINERLLKFKPEWGIPNCLFLNAQNKQTVQTIVRPLRELGIPAAGIVDIDFLKDGGLPLTRTLSSLNIPELEHTALSNTRQQLKAKFDETQQNMKTQGGIDLLTGTNREACQNFLDKMGEYGLFIVGNGELESWLKHLQISGHGPNWLISMFEKMGEEQETDSYIKPSEDDVWKFLFLVRTWLLNPQRKGIPT